MDLIGELEKLIEKWKKQAQNWGGPDGPGALHGCVDDVRALLSAAREPGEPLQDQIDRLATFIMDNVLGEPSQSEGAVDTAIRLLSTRPVPAPPPEPVEEETADFAWNEVLDAFKRVWPGDSLIYSESPVELIYRLRDERDEARDHPPDGGLREAVLALLREFRWILWGKENIAAGPKGSDDWQLMERTDAAIVALAASAGERPEVLALVSALRHVALKGHYGPETATIIDKALGPFGGVG